MQMGVIKKIARGFTLVVLMKFKNCLGNAMTLSFVLQILLGVRCDSKHVPTVKTILVYTCSSFLKYEQFFGTDFLLDIFPSISKQAVLFFLGETIFIP